MGKLHRIRKAFGKLPEEEKRLLYKHRGWVGARVGRNGVVFVSFDRSYRRYVRKMVSEYFGEVALSD